MDLYPDIASCELHNPDDGDIAADLHHIADEVIRLQTRTVAGQAFVGLIAERQIKPHTRRAIQRREIRPCTDIDLVIDALGGAVTFRLLQGHAPLTPVFTRALVALMLDGCHTKAAR
jgi:hypothetical protein